MERKLERLELACGTLSTASRLLVIVLPLSLLTTVQVAPHPQSRHAAPCAAVVLALAAAHTVCVGHEDHAGAGSVHGPRRVGDERLQCGQHAGGTVRNACDGGRLATGDDERVAGLQCQ